MRQDLRHILFLFADDIRAETDRLFRHASRNVTVDPVKRAAANEENVRRIDHDHFLVGVLAPTLWRNTCDRPLQNLEQRLLHAFPGNVTRDRCIFRAFRDIDNPALRAFNIVIRRLNQPQQNIFHVVADIARLRQTGRVGNRERHIQKPRQRLREQRFTAAGRTDQHDIGFLQFDIIGVDIALQPFVMVVHGDRQTFLGVLLTDDVLVQLVFNFAR